MRGEFSKIFADGREKLLDALDQVGTIQSRDKTLEQENMRLREDLASTARDADKLLAEAVEWKACAEAAEASEAKLLEALTLMYSRWEDGTTCYEACDGEIDESSSPIGNALRLSGEEEDQIIAAIQSAEERKK